MSTKVSLDDIVSLCKRRGFIYQGSEIYGGLAGTWDYGPLGVELKRNIASLWWQTFVSSRDDTYAVESSILMNQNVWKASGHVDTFSDPLIECKNCKSRFRADQIEERKCPNCGKAKTLSEPRQFNMMFETHIGPVGPTKAYPKEPIVKEDGTRIVSAEIRINDGKAYPDSSKVYLRPETAQGMFTNFKNILDSFSPDLPFGIAQTGKAFRNEISPRDFLFRAREFEIMELEYFISPNEWEKQFETWHRVMLDWFESLGLPKDQINEIEVPADDRAHYSKRTIDFEFNYPFGVKEIAGLAYRTDFDLANHEKHSGKNLKYIPKDGGEAFVPHVIEPTFGLDRHVLAVLANAYTEDEVNGEKRVFLKLPTHLAPVKVAVSPLLKNKGELVKKAREIYDSLKKEFGNVMWDDNGNIGKRYRRQDEIGTPYCVTIDFDTLEDNTVTVRNRDTTKQERVNIKELSKSLQL